MFGAATERTGFRTALADSRELLLLGRFNEALSMLSSFAERADPSATEAISIDRGKARVLMTQGYPLDVHLAYIDIVGCGKTLEYESVLARAEEAIKDLTVAEFDEGQIEMRGHLDKIAIVKQTLTCKEHSDCLPDIRKRLDALMPHLRALGRFYDIWALSAPYLSSKTKQDAVSWLEDLLSEPDLTPSLYGSFSLELAKRRAEIDSQQALIECLCKADAAFAESGHAFGRLEVQRLRLQHSYEEASDPLQALVRIIEENVMIDYPIGALQSAISPLTLAFKRGKYGLYINLQECFHNICKETGLKTEGLLLELQLLAALNAGTGHHATVLQLGRNLYSECKSLQYWTMAYLAGRVWSLALTMRGSNEQGVKISEELYEMCHTQNLKARSEAAYQLAVARQSLIRQNSQDRIVDCQHLVDFLLPIAESDIEQGEISLACEKLILIAGLQFETARHSKDDFETIDLAGRSTIDKVKVLTGQCPVHERLMYEGNCDELLITQLLFKGKTRCDNTLELTALDICTRLIAAYDRQDMQFHRALKYQFRGLLHQQIYQKSSNLQRQVDQLVAAEANIGQALDLLQAAGSWQMALEVSHSHARLHVEAWDLVKIPVEGVMNSLRHFELIADRQRRELSILGSLDALLHKQTYSATKHLQDLYRWAIAINSLSGMSKELLVWSQKRKARSLSEMLGLGIIVPSVVREALKDDPAMPQLLEELERLRFAFEEAAVNEKAYIFQRVEDCERKARENEVYNNFASLRDGGVTDISDLRLLSEPDASGNERAVVFVDWITRDNILFLVTANASAPETTCEMCQLSITVSAVKEWTTEHFSTPDQRRECLERDSLRNRSKPMRVLDPLISPLLRMSREGDLLLLSPTTILSTLPLHALCIDPTTGAPLIKRNPVVYVHSLPIAKVCAARANSAAGKFGKPLFFAVFDQGREADLIYEQSERLASKTAGQSFTHRAASKETYMAKVSEASLIHHHLHCVFSADNVLQQSITFHAAVPDDKVPSLAASMPSATAPGSEDALSSVQQALDRLDVEEYLLTGTGPFTSSLTVEELFKINLRRSPLVVLIACDSASQAFQTEGDEPLGLITGYLCAGAASVIGALWPIPSHAGREFSDAFYDQLLPSPGDNMEVMVNLAVALQAAVLTIRGESSTSSTYHWGAFCLYGAWLYQPPRVDATNAA
ncbi:uncharacterized protein AB675_532 [Cyphellophora attinorum]|uniref:CHAT domain-containing protein n=1 Tax=Cyphellophora attinorum TaxID=1664694 RepID=A0A0N0NSE6_9EURO|nr:uncharacterized protein AB675_532 [Phialophora attinorum]KPI45919.1 hypothetical protein AB675_532 [Phialophora attinorum]